MSIARKHNNAEIGGGHRKGREKKRETTKLVSCWSWIPSTMVDSRQILAGFLALTMFALLAHMIKGSILILLPRFSFLRVVSFL
ncbi:hypothetical protein Nepgr_022628 [Nepenthes gracilis]|uniref:Transmembrane protein n=1 Tax=Nepenthes gracilis TaxID=150966 RepID=A0AAD3T170_NEPGR|nr:hypothetical protein Nepgr_022628 [Nepenthes gracilis]